MQNVFDWRISSLWVKSVVENRFCGLAVGSSKSSDLASGMECRDLNGWCCMERLRRCFRYHWVQPSGALIGSYKLAEATHFRIIRPVSGIGFQPVELRMTGWKPIPLQKLGGRKRRKTATNEKPGQNLSRTEHKKHYRTLRSGVFG